MKLANLIGERFKETPSDCIIESHALMLRGGYMKYVANGIYSSLPRFGGSPKRSSRLSGRKWMPWTGRRYSSR